MNFFNEKDPFSFMNKNHHKSPEYFKELKGMMNSLNEVLSDDFWEQMNGFNQRKKSRKEYIPIEVWEDADHLYVTVVAPWIKDTKDVEVEFHNRQLLLVKAKVHSIKPPGGETLLYSEIPRRTFQKKFKLPSPVDDEQFSINFENGVLVITLNKTTNDHQGMNIPLDF
jgi:HSP20 family molecular chaperone IbpA